MIFEYLKLNITVKDEDFNSIYPEAIRILAKTHWTPVIVAKEAAKFLSEKSGTKVLDIGSGVGKFCMVGATFTKGHFTGIEQRERLCNLSNHLSQCYRLSNVKFIHSNITQIKFREYDAFYFYNPFHENIEQSAKIDGSVELGITFYYLYTQYVYEQLGQMPIGTRLATYWSNFKDIPPCYKIQSTSFEGLLKMWEKTS